jgi:hypothetical protein
VADSTKLILETGLVVPASNPEAWLQTWTRRELLTFLSQSGVRAPKSWSKDRLAELAGQDCEEAVRRRMSESGAVELPAEHAEAAKRLCSYIEDVKETWRVWLAFGTRV